MLKSQCWFRPLYIGDPAFLRTSTMPEVDEVTKQHKEVDLKKEIWLQSLPSSVRVLLHNTDDKSMDELSTLADDITTSQNAVRSPTVSTAAVRQQQHSS